MEIIIYLLITIIILYLLYKIINASESMEGFKCCYWPSDAASWDECLVKATDDDGVNSKRACEYTPNNTWFGDDTDSDNDSDNVNKPILHWVGDCNQCNKGVNWCDSSRWVPFNKDKFTISGELADWGCDKVNSSTQSTQDPSTGRVYVIENPNDSDSNTRDGGLEKAEQDERMKDQNEKEQEKSPIYQGCLDCRSCMEGMGYQCPN